MREKSVFGRVAHRGHDRCCWRRLSGKGNQRRHSRDKKKKFWSNCSKSQLHLNHGQRSAAACGAHHYPKTCATELIVIQTGKRKRTGTAADEQSSTSLHITVGSYERVLHGFAASFPSTAAVKDNSPDASFTDLFLLSPHTASIRCVALSPASHSKRILATGSSDERVNLFQISTHAPSPSAIANGKASALLLGPRTGTRGGRELGSLLHHTKTVTSLAFPSHSKILTASLDNTISILRTRDWTHLVTMRAPAPKPKYRPDGDTAGPGDMPAGVSDIAVHPSQRLALSVGLGERCMRLWNLVGGTKAGLLVFDKRILESVGEPRLGIRSGEGRSIVWREDGEMFAVAFERGVALFSLSCRPQAVLQLAPRQKVSQIRFFPSAVGPSSDDKLDESKTTLAVSTESGELIFYSVDSSAMQSQAGSKKATPAKDNGDLVKLEPVACIRSPQTSGPRSRVKDFQILADPQEQGGFFAVTGNSDGAVRVWGITSTELHAPHKQWNGSDGEETPAIGRLRGIHETGKRITCLAAFVMEEASTDEEDTNAKVAKVAASSDDEDDSSVEGGEASSQGENGATVTNGQQEDESDEDASGSSFDGFEDGDA